MRNKFCQILDRFDGIGIAGKNYDLNKISKILIPFNPSNCHWLLIFIDITNKMVYILDPLSEKVNDKTFSKASYIVSRILEDKLDMTFQTFNFDLAKAHTKQKDFKSCVVLICFYATSIAKGKI